MNVLSVVVDGSIYAWGYGKAFGSKTDCLLPSHVYKTNEGDTVSDIAGGDSHSLILLSCGAVYSWGNNFEVGTFSSSKVINTLINFNKTRSLYIALHFAIIYFIHIKLILCIKMKGSYQS